MNPIADDQVLVDDLRDRCKSKHECLIGIEHEKFVYSKSTRCPLAYKGHWGVEALLTDMQRFGWKPTFEMDNMTGLKCEKAAITLEPAGQFELSGKPWPDLHGVYDEMLEHRRQLSEIAAEKDLGVLALGFAPEWRRADLDWMPKSRYLIMAEYMPKVGVHGKDMMTRCCSFQINFDYCSEQDMRDKYRVAMALQPLIIVALANSPFAGGKDSGLTSYRNYVWLHTDSARCGILPLVFSPEMGFEGYVRRALDTPMYSVARGGRHVDLAGRYFRDMMKGNLSELPDEKPTLKDWQDHLNTLMHDVRLKDHLELRGNDSLDLEQSMALTAFWTGILYDDQALARALDLISNCDAPSLNQLRHRVPGLGLAGSDTVPVNGVYRASSLLDALEYATTLARDGLKRRQRLNAGNSDESVYLQPLWEILEARLSPAEKWQKVFHKDWRENIGYIYERAGF